MSGLVAIFDRSGRPLNSHHLDDLTRALVPRGPDGSGLWCQGSVGLGRSLLQTTCEVESVAGPIEVDGVHLAGDVRLDDRGTLLRGLQAAGNALSEQTPDVVLLLHAWRLWGAACLDHVAGDFAFALWDSRTQQLFAARDHFGIVPLFYAESGNTILVSNSLLCLLAYPGIDRSLHADTVADYLSVGANTRRDTTFYQGIKRVEPGCLLQASRGELRISSYWVPTAAVPTLRYRHAGDYVSHFTEIFNAAVHERARCDRVTTDLSGGMDASSIAVTLARLYGDRSAQCLRAYTCYFRDLIADEEGALGRLIASHSGIPHECLEIESIWDQSAPPGARHLRPEPGSAIMDSGRVVMNRLAARHGRVVFTGQGGDPLFGSFTPPSLRAISPAAAAYFLRDVAYCYRQHGHLLRLGLRGASAPPKAVPVGTDRFLNPDFVTRYDIDARRQEWLAARHRLGRLSMTNNVMWTAIFEGADADFTGLPLKARFPFFDLRLFRYLNQLPEYPWARDKLLLRLAMRGLLPEQVRSRRKTPLRVNPFVRHWQSKGPGQWIYEVLGSADLQPYIDLKSTLGMLREPQTWDRQTLSRFLRLCSFAVWLRDRTSADTVPNKAVAR